MNNNLLSISSKFLDDYKLDFELLKKQLTNIMTNYLNTKNCKRKITIDFEDCNLFGKSGSVSSNKISFNKTRLQTLVNLQIDDTSPDIIQSLELFYNSYITQSPHSIYEENLYEFIKKYKAIGAERFFSQVGSYKTIKYELLETIYHECQHILQDEEIVDFENLITSAPFLAFTKVCNKIFKEIKNSNIEYERNPDNHIFPIELDARYIALKLLTELRNKYFTDDEMFKIYLAKSIILPNDIDIIISAQLVYKEYERLFNTYQSNISTQFDEINKIINNHKSKIIENIIEIYSFMLKFKGETMEKRVNQEVEVAFKVKQSQQESEELLIKGGYELMFHTQTHDLYFTNKKLSTDMTEQEIKFSCIRFRHSGGGCSFDNYKLFDKNAEDKFRCSLDEAAEIIVKLKQNGFNKVFDTYKTDYVYKKDTAYHQLQKIRDIGLLDYYYDESIFKFKPEWQFMLLTNGMKNLGFELEYEEGIDKLRSLLAQKACFSKNQNGDYTAQ